MTSLPREMTHVADPVTIPSPRPAPGLLSLSPQQGDAVEKVGRWFHAPRSPQVFRMFGYAGTGKTTIARHIVATLGIAEHTIYAGFTGKSVCVLQSKGCEPASTIHALIYRPRHRDTTELDRLLDLRTKTTDPIVIDELVRMIRAEQRRLGHLRFDLRDASELADARLLVLDEASMVNDEMARDLMSFGTKILVLGDPAQLPPVFGDGFFTDAEPDHLLTEIHRSALDSPVTRIATAVRQAPSSDPHRGVPGVDGNSGRVRSVRVTDLAKFDVVLCWRNATRWAVIDAMRERVGRRPGVPATGDRIITLANNRDAAVFNGQMFTVRDVDRPRRDSDRFILSVVDDQGAERELTAWAAGFLDHDAEKLAARAGRKGDVVAATFGQAVTVHRAQGSQWDRVLVLDESPGLWGMTLSRSRSAGESVARARAHQEAQRWLYTGVTRAATQVVISTNGVTK